MLLGQAQRAALIALVNPISAHFEYFRPHLIFGLYTDIARNQTHGEPLRFFEIGKAAAYEKNKIFEENKLAAIIASSRPASELFYELKGYLDTFFQGLGISETVFKEGKENTAEIIVNDATLGFAKITDSASKKFFSRE